MVNIPGYNTSSRQFHIWYGSVLYICPWLQTFEKVNVSLVAHFVFGFHGDIAVDSCVVSMATLPLTVVWLIARVPRVSVELL